MDSVDCGGRDRWHVDVEALNDRLAREHPIDDYYARSPLADPVRRATPARDHPRVHGRRGRARRRRDRLRRRPRAAHVPRRAPHRDRRLRRLPRRSPGGTSPVTTSVSSRARSTSWTCHAASFDRIICTEVLEHVVDPDAVLAAIASLLRPSGVAVVTVPNDPLIHRFKNLVRRRPLGWALRDRIEWGGDAYHLHHWTPDEFERLLAAALPGRRATRRPSGSLPIRACFRCVPL